MHSFFYFIWIPGKFLDSQGIGYWQELSLWLPSSLQNTFPCLNNSKAIADCLSFRPLAKTVYDIWQWDQLEQPEYPSRLSPEKEKNVLQAWRRTAE
ncbi:hypothetical protein [Chlorogloeopsis sp. ULAP02]|uniref:hypothetical protein n=1 Tax=Chlorogloeopsis sp. ULAP02 TaxID=3107926 RepID=UPI0031359730